jgi:hypothetical protein
LIQRAFEPSLAALKEWRDATALAKAPHSGSGNYGQALKELAPRLVVPARR